MVELKDALEVMQLAEPYFKNAKLDSELALKEIATPSAVADYGKVYTKSDNRLYYQDGAGVEHMISLTDTNYAEMYCYDNTTIPTVINVAKQYHFIQGSAGAPIFDNDHLNNWTFAHGSIDSGASLVTDDATTSINIGDASNAHGLTSGDIVNVQSANHTGTVAVTVVDANNFTVPITYVGDESCFWQQGDRLIAGVGAAGTYQFGFNTSLLSAGNNKTYKFEIVKTTTHIDESACERKIAVGDDLGSMSSGGILVIADGDIVQLQVMNNTPSADTTDLTLVHSTIYLHRL